MATKQGKETGSLRVGELAKRTGLTVRTLHHWDAIGLLRPSGRSPAGYRLYGAADIERLHRIVGLRRLGLGLAEIRHCLDRPQYTLDRVLRLQLERVREDIAAREKLADRLEFMLEQLASAQPVTIEDHLQTMGMATMYEKYYSKEQLEYLDRRGKEVGEARMKEVQEEWPRLMAEVRAEMEKGTDPKSERVQALAARWRALIEEFTGGDPGIAASLERMYQEEPAARERAGLDPELAAYIGQAMKGSS